MDGKRKKPRLLILSASQFGYLTDAFKYCQYSRHAYEITYVGWDYGKEKFHLDGVTVKYISRQGSLLKRNWILLHAFHDEIQFGYDVVFSTYVRGISLIKLINKNVSFILDIRTLGVNPKRFFRWCYDSLLRLETLLFNHISIIDPAVAATLGIKSFFHLPLGGECFSVSKKTLPPVSLLYVGTLEHRNVLNCIKGFQKYLNEVKGVSEAPRFTIVGGCHGGGELSKINKYIRQNGLEDHVLTTGTLPQYKLVPYFEQANIGVAYVPIVPYFTNQPPTKTFEYLISGLPIIATSTAAHKRIVNDQSGVLIHDTPTAFYNGLKHIIENFHQYDSQKIRESYSTFQWQCIVQQRFLRLINQVRIVDYSKKITVAPAGWF